ncbi:TPA: hypothetical protein ACGUUK_004409 [Vibrio vulnificus]|uniref:hypothetical protein n=1 Tax=Vibrio vulnificus TaxID=672 RepID=UPI00138FFEE5|nr:hypothetical protein [Vibrio vulnificus]
MMELSEIKAKIIELLGAQFEQKFEESNLSARHYSFTSPDYDFSFSISLVKDVSESQLTNRINLCIKKAHEVSKPNTHFQFDENCGLYIV